MVVGGVILLLTINTPLIINDWKTGGADFKEFMTVALNRSGDAKSKHNLLDKSVRNMGTQIKYQWIILTGHQLAGLPEITGKKIECRYDCVHGWASGIISLVIFMAGWLFWYQFYTEGNSPKKKKRGNSRHFLLLVIIWWLIIFAVFTPLAYDLAPRFFLLNAPLMFILLGLFLQGIYWYWNNKNTKTIVGLVIIALIISNLFFVSRYFRELSQASTNSKFKLGYNDRILKEKTRITLVQINDINNWIIQTSEQNKYPILIHAQSEYERAILERLTAQENMRAGNFSNKLTKLYGEANYFLIIRTQSNQQRFLDKFIGKMKVIRKKEFGTMTVYQLSPKKEFITDGRVKIDKKNEPEDKVYSSSIQPRYNWRQIFSGCTYQKKSGRCEK